MTIRSHTYDIKLWVVRAICFLLISGPSELCAAADEPATPQSVPFQTNILCGNDVEYSVETDETLNKNLGLYLGAWTGIWNNSSKLCGALIVEKISANRTADIIYIYAAPRVGIIWKKQTQIGKIDSDGHLHFKDGDGGDFTFSIGERNTLVAQFTGRTGHLSSTFERK